MAIHVTTYNIDINDDHKTMVQKINANFQRVSQSTNTVETIASQSGGVESHQQLKGTSLHDCHPMTAVTDLYETISSIESQLTEQSQNIKTILADVKTINTMLKDHEDRIKALEEDR